MKLKVNSQVSLKGEPLFPHGPNLGPYAPLRFGYLGLGSVRFGYLRLSPSRTPFGIELPAISLEIDVFV